MAAYIDLTSTSSSVKAMIYGLDTNYGRTDRTFELYISRTASGSAIDSYSGPIAANVANLGLFKAMERNDIHISSTQVGDKYVFECMCKENDIVGGEQSGHIIFKEFEKTGDGLVTALMFLKVMKETGLTALELCEGLKIYPQLLINVKVSDKNAAMEDSDVKKAIEEVNSRLNGNGRILVRQSGTEPLVRVMAEAETDEICEREVNSIVEIVKNKFGI